MCTKILFYACTVTLFTSTSLTRISFVKLVNVPKLLLSNMFLEDLLEEYLVCFSSILLSDYKIFAMIGGENFA